TGTRSAGGASSEGPADDVASGGAAPPPREGSDRRALRGGTLRPGHGACGPPLARALQPRVPEGLRGAAPPIPPPEMDGARGGAAPLHRPLRGRHLLPRRPHERRLVHDDLPPALRDGPD